MKSSSAEGRGSSGACFSVLKPVYLLTPPRSDVWIALITFLYLDFLDATSTM